MNVKLDAIQHDHTKKQAFLRYGRWELKIVHSSWKDPVRSLIYTSSDANFSSRYQWYC